METVDFVFAYYLITTLSVRFRISRQYCISSVLHEHRCYQKVQFVSQTLVRRYLSLSFQYIMFLIYRNHQTLCYQIKNIVNDTRVELHQFNKLQTGNTIHNYYQTADIEALDKWLPNIDTNLYIQQAYWILIRLYSNWSNVIIRCDEITSFSAEFSENSHYTRKRADIIDNVMFETQ